MPPIDLIAYRFPRSVCEFWLEAIASEGDFSQPEGLGRWPFVVEKPSQGFLDHSSKRSSFSRGESLGRSEKRIGDLDGRFHMGNHIMR